MGKTVDLSALRGKTSPPVMRTGPTVSQRLAASREPFATLLADLEEISPYGQMVNLMIEKVGLEYESVANKNQPQWVVRLAEHLQGGAPRPDQEVLNEFSRRLVDLMARRAISPEARDFLRRLGADLPGKTTSFIDEYQELYKGLNPAKSVRDQINNQAMLVGYSLHGSHDYANALHFAFSVENLGVPGVRVAIADLLLVSLTGESNG